MSKPKLKIKEVEREEVTHYGKPCGWVVKLGAYLDGELVASFWSVHPIKKTQKTLHFLGHGSKRDAIETVRFYSTCY